MIIGVLIIEMSGDKHDASKQGVRCLGGVSGIIGFIMLVISLLSMIITRFFT